MAKLWQEFLSLLELIAQILCAVEVKKSSVALVIMSVGYKPAPLAEDGKHVHVVGDSAKVGNLRTVIWGAWDVAMTL